MHVLLDFLTKETEEIKLKRKECTKYLCHPVATVFVISIQVSLTLELSFPRSFFRQ
jgi:hypothetical protein